MLIIYLKSSGIKRSPMAAFPPARIIQFFRIPTLLKGEGGGVVSSEKSLRLMSLISASDSGRISPLFRFADLTIQWDTKSSWNIEIWRVLSQHRGDYLIAKLLEKRWGTAVLSSKRLQTWTVLCMPRISLLEKFNDRKLNSDGIR